MKCPFKNGERIICIRDTLKMGSNIIDSNCLGKMYELVIRKLPSNTMFIVIKSVSDGKMYLPADWSHYISLNEHRKLKLKKINGNNNSNRMD